MGRHMFKRWIKDGLERPGKSAKGLADALGIHQSTISKIISGERKLRADELPIIARYLEVDPPIASHKGDASVHVGLVTVTEIAARGVWREASAVPMLSETLVPIVPDSRYYGMDQFAVRVDTADFFKAGDFAVFVPFGEIRKNPRDRDIVLIKRSRGDLVETTIRRVSMRGDVINLVSEPEVAGASPEVIPYDHSTTEIVGLFIGLFRPAINA